MPRPPSPARCPIVRWLHAVRTDADLCQEVRDHLLATGRQALRDATDAGVVHRGCVAAWLHVYHRMVERPPDALTSGRLLAELTRCARALGLLGKPKRKHASPFRARSRVRAVISEVRSERLGVEGAEHDESGEDED